MRQGKPCRIFVIQISVCRHGPTANASRTASDEWLPRAARLRTAVQISVYRSQNLPLGEGGPPRQRWWMRAVFPSNFSCSWLFLRFSLIRQPFGLPPSPERRCWVAVSASALNINLSFLCDHVTESPSNFGYPKEKTKECI